MIKNILLLSIVLLSTITIISVDAQLTAPYITTDKDIYYFGDDIVFTIQFDEPLSGTANLYAIGTVSESTMISGERFQADENNRFVFTYPTTSLDGTKHSVMPNDGYFTAHVQYSIYDPITGYTPANMETTFLYLQYDYDVTDTFAILEEQIEINEEDIIELDNGLTTINSTLTITNSDLGIAQQDIIDLQNTPVIPDDLLSRINDLELQNAVYQIRITDLETDLVTLQLQQVPTNAELETLITSNTGKITALENNPIGGINAADLQNGLDSLETKMVGGQTNAYYTIHQIENKLGGLSVEDENINDRIDLVNGTTTQHRAKIIQLVTDNISQNQRMDGIDGDIVFNSEYIQQIAQFHRDDVARINGDVGALEIGLTTLNGRSDLQDAALDLRVTQSESDIVLLRDDLTHDSIDLYSKVNVNKISIGVNEDDISNLQNKVTTIVNENATPQDVEQNLRIDEIETNLQTTNDALTNSTILLRGELIHADLALYSDIHANEVRVTELETDAAIVTQVLEQADTAIATNQDDIVTLQSDTVRFDRFTEATTSTLQFQEQQGQDNHDSITTINQKIVGFDDNVESVGSEIDALHLRDKQLESKMFQEHTSLTKQFTGQDDKITDLQTDVANIEFVNNSNDNTQDDRLLDLESQYDNLDTKVDQNIVAIKILNTNFVDITKQIDNIWTDRIDDIWTKENYDFIISEIGQLWIDMAEKQNVFDAP